MVSGRQAKAARRGRGPRTAEPDPIVQLLMPLPDETVPLWAQLFVVHQSLAGVAGNSDAALGSCVTTCHILAGSLTHLGFASEPMAAAVQVLAAARGATAGETSVGMVDQPPIIRADGTTNGHMIVWVASMGRLVDPTVAQEPRLHLQAQEDQRWGLPAVLPVQDRHTLLTTSPSTMRGAYQLVWHLYPEWTDILDGVLTDAMREAFPYASLNLARKALDILRQLAAHRDPGPMLATHAYLRDLLTHDVLPALPPIHQLSPAARRLLQL